MMSYNKKTDPVNPITETHFPSTNYFLSEKTTQAKQKQPRKQSQLCGLA